MGGQLPASSGPHDPAPPLGGSSSPPDWVLALLSLCGGPSWARAPEMEAQVPLGDACDGGDRRWGLLASGARGVAAARPEGPRSWHPWRAGPPLPCPLQGRGPGGHTGSPRVRLWASGRVGSSGCPGGAPLGVAGGRLSEATAPRGRGLGSAQGRRGTCSSELSRGHRPGSPWRTGEDGSVPPSVEMCGTPAVLRPGTWPLAPA